MIEMAEAEGRGDRHTDQKPLSAIEHTHPFCIFVNLNH